MSEEFFYPDDEDIFDPEDSEVEFDLEDDEYDWEHTCVICGQRADYDVCQCCGAPLCFMHAEIGAGFCHNCPTPDYNPLADLEPPDAIGHRDSS